MSVELLYIECGYIDPYYIDGDEVCDIRGSGGGREPDWRVAHEVMRRTWLPKLEPVSAMEATIRSMIDEAGVDMRPADLRFLVEFVANLDEAEALPIVSGEIERIAEQQREAERLRMMEMQDREAQRRLGYSPKKLNAAWAELTKTLN